MLAGDLHSVIQEWRVLKIVKKMKTFFKVQWNLYAYVIDIHVHVVSHAVPYENVAVVLHIDTFIHVEYTRSTMRGIAGTCVPFMAKFEILEFEERLTDNYMCLRNWN